MIKYDKYIKALLISVNKLGHEINYETVTKYNAEYDRLLTSCYLKKWYSRYDEKKDKEIRWCDTKEFSGVSKYVNVIKYLKAIVGGENE